MNTNITEFAYFSKIFASLCLNLDESSLSIGRVKSVKQAAGYSGMREGSTPCTLFVSYMCWDATTHVMGRSLSR